MTEESQNQQQKKPIKKTTSNFEALPTNYVCKRCGIPGHHVKSCPTNNDPNYDPPQNKVKKAVGIPNNFLKKIDQTEAANFGNNVR